MDLTTLEGADTPARVRSMCARALRPDPSDVSVPQVAAVCVYPDLVATAVEALAGSDVRVASVATAFPSGRASRAVKLLDTGDAVDAGAHEIDMVIDRGAFLSGRYGAVLEEIRAIKQRCGDVHLKVILETGELATYDNVRRASWLALIAGADVIKTSTGKVSPAATAPVALVMLQAVRDFAQLTGEARGVKVAGGIRTTKDAIRHLVLVNETLGCGLAHPGALPHRCIRTAHRPADAAPQARRGRVRQPRPCHPRLRPPPEQGVPVSRYAIDLGTPGWDYASAPESRDLARLDRAAEGLLFIGGAWQEAPTVRRSRRTPPPPRSTSPT
jgi:deoxyribose-phosphate aldolase